MASTDRNAASTMTRDPDGVPAPPRRGSGGEASFDPTRLEDALSRVPWAFDLFQALRRLECAYRDKPRFGRATRPGDEPVRLGQEPSLAFATSAVASFEPGADGGAPRMTVNSFGMFGPNGALPLHLTEYVRDRERNSDDPTLAAFIDMFHHRMMLLFYRAWADAQPSVSHDRKEEDAFATYLASLQGLGMPSLRGRDEIPDFTKLYFAGRLGAQVRNAEGLQALITEYFGVPVRIEEFIGQWIDLPDSARWQLGSSGAPSHLGQSTTVGARAWHAQSKFRVVLGPLSRDDYQRMLPQGDRHSKLMGLVRTYVGAELDWDLQLLLGKQVDQPLRLGQSSHLGWTSWLGHCPAGAGREDLVLEPVSQRVRKGEMEHV